jgi:hypothetical protein
MDSKYEVHTFGRDCLGNITGYRVGRYVWRYTGNSYRADGMNLIYDLAGQFVGNIYEPGSFGRAKTQAEVLARRLNAQQLTTPFTRH